jgi:hypothetical protein
MELKKLNLTEEEKQKISYKAKQNKFRFSNDMIYNESVEKFNLFAKCIRFLENLKNIDHIEKPASDLMIDSISQQISIEDKLELDISKEDNINSREIIDKIEKFLESISDLVEKTNREADSGRFSAFPTQR